MKRIALFISSVVLCLAVLTPQHVMAQNKIKSVKYLNHKYKGEVNNNKTPDGEGELEMFGVKGLVKGFFQGNYVKNATIDGGRLKFTGDLTYDESDNITLKAGGTFIYYYCFLTRSGNIDFSWELAKESYGTQSFTEQLTSDKTVGIEAFGISEKEIAYPIKLIDDKSSGVEIPSVPVKTKLSTRQYKYEEYIEFLGRREKVERVKELFVLDRESLKKTRVKEYTDEQGRVWNFYGSGQYKVTFPDGSYYAKTGESHREFKWTINNPNVGLAEFDSEKGSVNIKLKDGIEVYKHEFDNGFKFSEINNSKDFSKFYLYDSSIQFNDINIESLSEKDVENLIREKIVPMFGEHAYDINNVGRYDKYDKDGYSCSDCNYSYMSTANKEKKQNALSAKREAEEAKAERDFIAQFKKKYGFDPSTISPKKVLAPGRSWSALAGWNDWCKKYGTANFIFAKLIKDNGSSKCYSFTMGFTDEGHFWIRNGKISSVTWY